MAGKRETIVSVGASSLSSGLENIRTYSTEGSWQLGGEHRGPSDRAFRIISKNSLPVPVAGDTRPDNPYSASAVEATRYHGTSGHSVTFVQRIETEDEGVAVSTLSKESILRKAGNHSLLLTNSEFELYPAEIGPLIAPFFYQDDENTFFVEPSLEEITIEQWEEWIITTPGAGSWFEFDEWWDAIPIHPAVPIKKPPAPIGPLDAGWIDPVPHYIFDASKDWLTGGATVLRFADRVVGRAGGIGISKSPTQNGNWDRAVSPPDGVNHGLGDPRVSASPGEAELSIARDSGARGILNVVGGGGLDPAILLSSRSNGGFEGLIDQPTAGSLSGPPDQ